MTPQASPASRQRWDALDDALTTLRRCVSTKEFTEYAAKLALIGCSAQAVALGRVTEQVCQPWLRAGDTSLLEPGGGVTSGLNNGGDVLRLDQQVIRSGRTHTRQMSTSTGERRTVVAPVGSLSTVVGLLQVVGHDLDMDIVETFADALGSFWALARARQRVDELGYVLTRLRSTLKSNAARRIELVDAMPDVNGGLPAVINAQANSTALRSRLTARQREVLDLMMTGLSNSEIAEGLVIAVPTVKSHVRAVLRASGAVNRSEALARFARMEGPTNLAR
jgi:DNA-binding CsgD family transcriptional regulator